MSQRGKGRIAKLLSLVMLAVFLCGSTVMASGRPNNGWLTYVDQIKAGERIVGISAGPESDKYRGYSFYVNGTEYQCEDGRVFLNPYQEVRTVEVDHANKTVKVTGDPLIELKIAGKSSYRKIGETVTVNLGQEYKAELDKGGEFIKWQAWAWKRTNDGKEDLKKYDTLESASAILGVSQETLQDKNCTITFTIPDEWKGYMQASVGPAIKNADSTISGNVPSKPENVSSSSAGGGGSRQETEQESASRKRVVLSNGTTLTSASAMHNVATGINGAVVTTTQETMNAGAGLSRQDVEAGANAKLYMGNTYKKAEKTALNDAVSQLGASMMTMVNIDLYTIAKNGTIENIGKINGEEAVRVVIGLPSDVVKDGRSFSLVYMDENGQAVEIPDLDNDPRTLTVDLTRFGSFAIVYR